MLTFDLAASIHLRNFAPPQLPCGGVLFRQTMVVGSDVLTYRVFRRSGE